MADDTQNTDQIVNTDAPAETVLAAAPVVAGADLEKQQNERVAPVVQGILEDATTMLIPEDGVSFDLSELELATIQRLLNGDLNITTEVPLAFQGVLGAFANLTNVLQDCAYAEPHSQADYARVSRAILSIVAQTKPEDMKPALETLFAENKMSAIDVRYIVSSITSTFETMRLGAEKSIEESMERAQAKSFGVESVQDVTMGKLDAYLTH